MTKKFAAIVFLIFLLKTSLHAIEPDVFVQSTVNRASKLLSENIDKDQKIMELKNIAKETVDIRGIGYYSLGPIRKTLNKDQLKKYSSLFEQYFLKSLENRCTYMYS